MIGGPTGGVGLLAANVTRRNCLLPSLIGLGLLSIQEHVWAGGQIEEPMADAVRNAMSAAVHGDAPPEPVFQSTDARLQYLRWKIEMNKRLISRKTDLRTFQERDEFLQSVWYNSKRTRLDVELVLGLIQVESNFRKRAISSVGARGYMQVMPFWMRLLGEGDVAKLFHMQTNLRFGCVILRHYLDREKGDLFLALGRYNGSRGKPQYPDAVFANKRLWEFVPK